MKINLEFWKNLQNLNFGSNFFEKRLNGEKYCKCQDVAILCRNWCTFASKRTKGWKEGKREVYCRVVSRGGLWKVYGEKDFRGKKYLLAAANAIFFVNLCLITLKFCLLQWIQIRRSLISGTQFCRKKLKVVKWWKWSKVVKWCG